MKPLAKWLVPLITLLLILLVGIGDKLVSAQEPTVVPPSAQSESEDQNEGPDVAVTGTALERASVAALASTGEGRVTETEVRDEEGYYEIEVTLDNGKQVDVHLDENFNVLSTIGDGEEDGD